MKTKFETYYYFALAMVTFIMSDHVHAIDNVNINFTGLVKSAACEVISGSDQTVHLGDISTTNFVSAGDVSQAKMFTIDLNCPNGGPDKGTVTFSGTSSTDSSLLALDNISGVATGVAVRISENDHSTQVKLNVPSKEIPLNSGINTLTFYGQYQALVQRSEIKAGIANATAQFTINYP